MLDCGWLSNLGQLPFSPSQTGSPVDFPPQVKKQIPSILEAEHFQ
jgi:hypothetical protein